MKAPNYDDVDLGIVAIVCIVALGLAGGIALVYKGVEAKDIGVALAFLTTAIGTIGGLARGRNKGKGKE